MTTKLRRGRDPEQHELVFSGPAAKRYVGLAGQVTLIADADTGQIVGLLASDGMTSGGFVAPLIPSTDVKAALGLSYAVPVITASLVADTGYPIEHGLGYSPMVQILSSAGLDITSTIAIAFTDTDTVTLTSTVDLADVKVLLR